MTFIVFAVIGKWNFHSITCVLGIQTNISVAAKSDRVLRGSLLCFSHPFNARGSFHPAEYVITGARREGISNRQKYNLKERPAVMDS